MKFTDEELTAGLLKAHPRGTWPNTPLGLGDTPMRRALKAAGLIETRRVRHGSGAWRWYITPAGRERLVNVPGSGITRSADELRPGQGDDTLS